MKRRIFLRVGLAAMYLLLIAAGTWFYDLSRGPWHEGDSDRTMGAIGLGATAILALAPLVVFVARRDVGNTVLPWIQLGRLHEKVLPFNSRLQRTNRLWPSAKDGSSLSRKSR